jgi:serine phosphatase RsbU (regulator of sigma subunit)
MLISGTSYCYFYLFASGLIQHNENVVQHGAFGDNPFRLILYSALVIALAWIFIRSQTRSLIRTRRLLNEKEKALFKIEIQRAELEYKNKSITDSLNYAQRIQEALLPSETYLKKHFSDSFILYKPKDIVSGDFYWIGEKGHRIFIVAADCTGHGVPGALMSMIGHDLLDKIINSENIEQPGTILDRLTLALEATFSREKNIGTIIRDGMDIGICSIDKKKMKAEYAGAFFPLYIIRDNRLIEIKGDKYTLGMTPAGVHYLNNETDLMENDMLYLFSDGYVDQFGGDENKKFMYRRFRYLLMTIHKFPVSDQKAILEENIKTWMGNDSQVDDILVIGFRPI